MTILLILALWALSGYVGMLMFYFMSDMEHKTLMFLPWQLVMFCGPTIIGVAAFLLLLNAFDWLRKRL